MTEETALTTAAAAFGDSSLAEIGEEELRAILASENAGQIADDDLPTLPRLRIVQKELGDWPDLKPGTFYIKGQEELGGFENPIVVVLEFAGYSRVRFVTPYDPDAPLLCASDDGIAPRPSTEQRPLDDRQAGPCATCPYAQWGEDGSSPACRKQRNFLMLIWSEGLPPQVVRWTAAKSAVPHARKLNALIKAGTHTKQALEWRLRKKTEPDVHYVPYHTPVGRLALNHRMQNGIPLPGLRYIAEQLELYRGYIRSGQIEIGADEDVIDGEVVNETTAPPPPEEETGDPIPF